jgi:hypothetical protein
MPKKYFGIVWNNDLKRVLGRFRDSKIDQVNVHISEKHVFSNKFMNLLRITTQKKI